MFSQTFLASSDVNDDSSCHFCTDEMDEIYRCHDRNLATCGPANRRVPDKKVNKNIPEELWGKPCCRCCYDFWFSYKRPCAFVDVVVNGVKIHTGNENLLGFRNVNRTNQNPNIPEEYKWVIGQPCCWRCYDFWRGFGWECFFKGKEGEYACRDPGAGACRTVPSVELEGLPAGAIGQRCCTRCYNYLLKKLKKNRQQL